MSEKRFVLDHEDLEKIIADVETSVGMDITNLIDNDMCR